MNLIAKIIVFAIPVLYAIVFHEVAHGFAAYHFGDPTAKLKGRLKLNPISHIDPVGTIIVPAILIYSGLPGFGWAKPVPVNFNNLRRPKRDMTLVSFAGPGTNFVMAFLALIVIKLIYMIDPGVFEEELVRKTALTFILRPLSLMVPVFFLVNILLGIFNLLPIPPLDGGRIMTGILPGNLSKAYAKIEPFGFIIVLMILVMLSSNVQANRFIMLKLHYLVSNLGDFMRIPLVKIINNVFRQ